MASRFSSVPRSMQVRSFSAAASKAFFPSNPLPPSFSGVRGAYVTAVWQAALRTNAVSDVSKDLKHLRDSLRANSQLSDALNRSKTNGPQVFAQMKLDSYNKLTTTFVKEVLEAGRGPALLSMINGFIDLAAFANKESVVTVTSATPLNDAEADRIKKALAKLVEPDRKLRFTFQYDPQILAGLVVLVDGYQLDLSLASSAKEHEKRYLAASRKKYALEREHDPMLEKVAEHVRKFKARLQQQQPSASSH